MSQPTLETMRLILRPFRETDAPAIKELAGDRAIADTTLNVPHPYKDGMAEEWLETHEPDFEAGTGAIFAVVLRESDRLVGAIGLTIDKRFNKAELGYWVGKPYWNEGYATEAARAILEYGFTELELNRIAATHLSRNPASGRVMQKAGMQLEGTARQGTIKWGQYEDLVVYAVVRDDWNSG